ncbi:hypothetical protein ACFQZO_21215 [Bradyrhizobium sp. GCM10027634]|uniref:hypothetical protein n=1 Tax=unclassified Bradyrhizobium TaxID=2631580 RepID=UPI00188C7A59|nr:MULTISPECIES: hypothetical protein [unclassified Bradyrhizobium]MDN5003360.1 hypothetical protein [Bradyrhizobium sp. WYCCWR 12677]
MNFARRRPWTNTFSTEALCTRILARHRASTRVPKPRRAVADSRPIIGTPLTLSNKQAFFGTDRFESAASSRNNRINGYATVVARSRPGQPAHP